MVKNAFLFKMALRDIFLNKNSRIPRMDPPMTTFVKSSSSSSFLICGFVFAALSAAVGFDEPLLLVLWRLDSILLGHSFVVGINFERFVDRLL
jgi:hypothetical protein